jgi:hypothetical protein
MTDLKAQARLDSEIREFFDQEIDAKRVISIGFAVGSLIKSHGGISGDDARWYSDCAFIAVWNAVTKYHRTVKAAEESPTVEQRELFPGYRRLQRRYSVERSSERYIVPVEELTDAEIDTKIAEHYRQSEGHRLHAQELERFKDERRSAA